MITQQQIEIKGLEGKEHQTIDDDKILKYFNYYIKEDVKKVLEEHYIDKEKVININLNYEKLLDEFIEIEREKTRIGSGDDLFYEEQLMDYINKQRKFWITFMIFIEQKLKEGLEL